MSFETTFPINGVHGFSGGTTGDVWLGTLPPEELPIAIISKVEVAAPSGRVLIVDVNGTTTTYDRTTASGNNTQNDVEWPTVTNPTSDSLLMEVAANRKVKGFMLWLTRPTNWTDSNLSWNIDYPSANSAAMAPITTSASSALPSALRTNGADTLVYVKFGVSVDTNSIASVPVPEGSSDAFWKRIRVRIAGTITGGTVYPAYGRVWPVYDNDEKNAYFDFTSIIQPLVNPVFTAWPDQIVVRSGDTTLFMAAEWPAHLSMNIVRPSGTSGAATFVYSSSTGIKAMPANGVSNDADFGRAAVGSYHDHWAKPEDATKMWLLTYTLNGTTLTVFQNVEPTLPAGASLVRKLNGYAIGRRYDVDHNTLVDAFHMTAMVQTLDPARMTTQASIKSADTLKEVTIAGQATNINEPSTYQLINTRTGVGPIITGTMLADTPSITTLGNFSRNAGDGYVLLQIVGKNTPGAESIDGFVYIAG